MEQHNFGIQFGIGRKLFSQQLREQGYRFKNEVDGDMLENADNDVAFLHIHHFITDKEKEKILDRLWKFIVKNKEHMEN